MKSEAYLQRMRRSYKLWKSGYNIMQCANRITISSMHGYVLNDLKGAEAKSILDIGCGQARLLRRLSKQKDFKSSKLYGLDKDQKDVARARKLSKGRITFFVGDLHSFPIKRRFDLILTTISFHEWKDPKKALKNILRHLEKRGKFVIYDTYPVNSEPLKAKYPGFKCTIKVSKPLVKAVFERKL